ncbi:hypothetical protein PO909_033211 [Leuciscus waleckii]
MVTALDNKTTDHPRCIAFNSTPPQKQLSNFVSKHTGQLFTALNIPPHFLTNSQDTWDSDNNYIDGQRKSPATPATQSLQPPSATPLPPFSGVATHRACWEPSLPGRRELDLSPWLLCSFLNVSSDVGFFGLAGLPRNTGFTWVEHHHASAADLRADSALPQALPLPSVIPTQPQPSGLLLPSWWVVTSAPARPPRSSESGRCNGSLGSHHIIVISGRPCGVCLYTTMAPPSVTVANVGHCLGCGLNLKFWLYF